MSGAWPTRRSARPAVRCQDFDQAIRLDGSFAKAFVNRGNIYQSTHHYDLALADYSAAVELNPKDAYSLYSRGLTMRALGQDEAAERGYRQGQGDRAGHRALSPTLASPARREFHGDSIGSDAIIRLVEAAA